MISDLERPLETSCFEDAWYKKRKLEVPHPDIARYGKLRMMMGMNMKATWNWVEQLASIACYVGTNDFDQYLDELTPDRIREMLGIKE
jgi:hypothetical protein